MRVAINCVNRKNITCPSQFISAKIVSNIISMQRMYMYIYIQWNSRIDYQTLQVYSWNCLKLISFFNRDIQMLVVLDFIITIRSRIF